MSENPSSRVAQVLAFSTILFGATAAVPAHAYLDPGTGSMMLQLLMGGVVGALVVGKLYMQRAREFLRSVGRRIRAG